VRWLYHVYDAAVSIDDPYGPASLAQEGFVHCSFRDAVMASARLYFAADARLGVMQIDPRRLGCELRVVATPRGPMPHVHGAIPRAAIVRTWTIAAGADGRGDDGPRDQSSADPLGDAPDALDDGGAGTLG
jgi:uncharacterized protein (DUF952 family)